jgi:ubiquinone/menaquinone biosynthesis C-methylase UbiE
MDIAPGNQEAVEAWNTVLFDKFLAYRRIVTEGLGAHSERALALHPPPAGARVIDLGCGFGDTTVRLAELVGPNGFAVGVDAAPRFVGVATAEVEATGRRNVRFEIADVEVGLPDGPYDRAFSRFGTMFFASPVRALKNVRAALAPDGQLVMIVWRKKSANAAFYAAELVAREVLGEPPKGDAVTCGPGPFSMADADATTDMLVAAGFRDVALARCDAEILVGQTVDDAIEFALTLGPAGEVVRLAGQKAIDKREQLEAGLRGAMGPLLGPDGVWAPSSSWIVSARP